MPDAVACHLALRATPRPHLADPLLELQVRGDQDAVRVPQPGRQVVAAFMPALRRRSQRFVVGLLGVFDGLLETDVSPDLVARRRNLPQRQRNTPFIFVGQTAHQAIQRQRRLPPRPSGPD